MKRTAAYVLAVFALLLASAGCASVKEDRLVCPLFVFFDGGVNRYGCTTSAAVRIIRGEYISVAGVFPMEDFEAPFFSVETQRGENTCSVVCGGTVMGHNVIYRTGEGTGEVYALVESFTAAAEDEEYTVLSPLCRQTAPVRLSLLNEGGGDYPLDLRIRSAWAGFDILTLAAVKGDYSFDITAPAGNAASFFLPRQGDDTLLLEFLKDGTVVGQYALGEAVIRSGYDWTKSHLEAIEMEVNFSLTGVEITVNDWREQIVINMTI